MFAYVYPQCNSRSEQGLSLSFMNSSTVQVPHHDRLDGHVSAADAAVEHCEGGALCVRGHKLQQHRVQLVRIQPRIYHQLHAQVLQRPAAFQQGRTLVNKDLRADGVLRSTASGTGAYWRLWDAGPSIRNGALRALSCRLLAWERCTAGGGPTWGLPSRGDGAISGQCMQRTTRPTASPSLSLRRNLIYPSSSTLLKPSVSIITCIVRGFTSIALFYIVDIYAYSTPTWSLYEHSSPRKGSAPSKRALHVDSTQLRAARDGAHRVRRGTEGHPLPVVGSAAEAGR